MAKKLEIVNGKVVKKAEKEQIVRKQKNYSLPVEVAEGIKKLSEELELNESDTIVELYKIVSSLMVEEEEVKPAKPITKGKAGKANKTEQVEQTDEDQPF